MRQVQTIQLSELDFDKPKHCHFNIDLVSGQDFTSLEQVQSTLLTSLPDLIANAVRFGLETGQFQIVDNRIVKKEG